MRMRILSTAVAVAATVLLAGCAGIPQSGAPRIGQPVEGAEDADVEFLPEGPESGASQERILQIIATETGIMHRMQKDAPEKQFLAADPEAVCAYMKTITLENTKDSLLLDRYHVSVPPDIAARARAAVDRMVALGPAVARKPGD